MNIDKKYGTPLAYMITALILTAVSTVLRTVDLLLFFDNTLGYYNTGAPLPIVANSLLFAGAVFLVAFPFFAFRKRNITHGTPSTASRAVSVIAALPCVTAIVLYVISAVTTKDRLNLSFAFLAALCAAYFIFDMFKLAKEIRIALGATIILDLTVQLALSYFNQEVQMNAPDKILFGLACISAMLFIANEMKLLADNCRPTVYIFTSACTLLFCATSSVPSIIAYHAGMLPEKNGLYTEYYLLLGLAIYAASRLVTATLNINAVACGLDTNHPTNDVTNSDGEHDDKENTEQP